MSEPFPAPDSFRDFDLLVTALWEEEREEAYATPPYSKFEPIPLLIEIRRVGRKNRFERAATAVFVAAIQGGIPREEAETKVDAVARALTHLMSHNWFLRRHKEGVLAEAELTDCLESVCTAQRAVLRLGVALQAIRDDRQPRESTPARTDVQPQVLEANLVSSAIPALVHFVRRFTQTPLSPEGRVELLRLDEEAIAEIARHGQRVIDVHTGGGHTYGHFGRCRIPAYMGGSAISLSPTDAWFQMMDALAMRITAPVRADDPTPPGGHLLKPIQTPLALVEECDMALRRLTELLDRPWRAPSMLDPPGAYREVIPLLERLVTSAIFCAAEDPPVTMGQVRALQDVPTAYAMVKRLGHWAATQTGRGEEEKPKRPKPTDDASVRPQRSRRMSREEANDKAKELAKKDRFFVERSLREWAEAIGCSEGLVDKLPMWRETMRQTGRGREDAGSSPKVVSLTGDLEAVTGEGGRDVVLNRLIAEQDRDREPSPLDDDSPDSRPMKVHSRKRL